jgi:CPA2 family monovalent cation:H+ antiporter-2
VALVLRKWPQAMIPGYLIVGALIGPNALGIARGADETQGIASLSTTLLLFTIGLHLDIASVRGGLLPPVLITLVSTVVMLGAGTPIGVGLGLPLPAALAVCGALAISSTAVVLRILEQKRELHRVHGRLVFGILLIQDLVSLVILAAVPVLAAWQSGGDRGSALGGGFAGLTGAAGLAARTAWAIGGIGLLILIGRIAMPRMLRAAAGSGETLLVVSSALALGAAVATAGLGFSPELGAFLAGFLLASTPFRYQIAGQLVPLRDLFLAMFFTTLGLGLPIGTVVNGWWIVLLAVAATVAIKIVVISATSWLMGAGAAVGAYAGLALALGSEFSLVILAESQSKGVITADQYGYAIATVIVTLVVTPALVNGARRAARWAARVPAPPWVSKGAVPRPEPLGEPAEAPPEAPAAVIAGFGPVGRAVADQLEKRGMRVTIIELNPRTVERQYRLGRSIVYGDAANPEVLEQAGLSRADAVILTMPDEEAVLRACRLIRSLRPNAFIAARLNALSKALQAMQLGADHTVVEEMATAEAMAREVIQKIAQRQAGEDTGPRLYEFEA